MARLPLIHPGLTNAEWQQESHRLFGNDAELSEPEEDLEFERLYAGLLTLGHQGCQSYHALVVTGPDAGRVVNVDTEGHKPQFAFEANFMDWYERWLDEIISGQLIHDQTGWFGYDMGGDYEHLIRVYDDADDHATKHAAIRGLLKLVRIDGPTIARLDQIYREPNRKIKGAALEALCKFDISTAQPHLEQFI